MPEKPLLAQRYRLLTEVGRGGMGTVWHARDEALGRDVAVKEVILPHGFSDEEREIQHKRTFREARTAARLSHPGVVTVYDVVEEDGRPWIVMELIRARSLEQMIKQDGPLTPRRAAEIGRQMLSALMAAHEAGILHRDVKPSNVLVSDARSIRAVLTDFGIARAQSDATLTQTGMLIGSPAYIAPERARGGVGGARLRPVVARRDDVRGRRGQVAVRADGGDGEPGGRAHRGARAGAARRAAGARDRGPAPQGPGHAADRRRRSAVMLERILMDERESATRVMGAVERRAVGGPDEPDEPSDMPVTGQVMTPPEPDETVTDGTRGEDARPVWLCG